MKSCVLIPVLLLSAACVPHQGPSGGEAGTGFAPVLVDFDLDGGRYLTAEGWASPETADSDGTTFTWATGAGAGIEVDLEPGGPLHLAFRAWPFSYPGSEPQTGAVRFNDYVLGSFEFTRGAGEYRFEVPAGVVQYGRNRIDFEFARVVSPVAVDPSSVDERTLAAAFDWLVISDGPIDASTVGELRSAKENRPLADGTSVLLIVADTLRADVLGCYGGAASTPNLDALAASGVLFEHAFSHIPITGPSHASLFTSLLPSEHGVLNNTQILDDRFVTVAELLRDRRYRTAAFTSLGVLNRRFGMAQGFETYGDDFAGDWMRTAEELNAMAAPWIESWDGGSFFVMLHYSDPHEPYTPPGIDYPRVRMMDGDEVLAEFVGDGREKTVSLDLAPGVTTFRFEADEKPKRSLRFQQVRLDRSDCSVELTGGWKTRQRRFGAPSNDTLLPAEIAITNSGAEAVSATLIFGCKENLLGDDLRQRYRLETEYLDRQIGLMLDRLEDRGMLEDTLIVFVGDHGEGLGDHDLLGHCVQLYDTLIRVPLIMKLPGRIEAGRRVGSAVGLVDFLPTVLEMLGMDRPAGLSGTSLWPLIDGGSRTLPVFAETFRPEAPRDKRAVVYGDFKYIRTLSDETWEQLFEYRDDPGELSNVRDARPDVTAELREIIDTRFSGQVVEGADRAELSAEDKARLEALGYLH